MPGQESTSEKTKYLKIHLKSGNVINLSEEAHDIKAMYSSIIDGYSLTTTKLYIPHSNIDYAELG